MSLTKYERFETEHQIFQTRVETGLQAMRSWLFARREEINLKWPGMIAEDLTRMQGEALLVNRLIKMIDVGPTIPRETKEVTNG